VARQKREEAPKGSPAWMATFSDLMNLLLCFFVLLFSMSTVDAKKFEMVVASMQSSFSVLPAGGSSIGEGELVSSGVSQLKEFSMFFEQFNSEGEKEAQEEKELKEEYEEAALKESEEMAEEVSSQATGYGIQNQVEVDFNAEYVLLTLNGALLFDSGKSEIRTEAHSLVDKIGAILSNYSMYRALRVADYIRGITNLEPSLLKSSGRGEYVPIADNATPEGRARNRRVEIKIYNSYSSNQ